jgi:hypothetical protein
MTSREWESLAVSYFTIFTAVLAFILASLILAGCSSTVPYVTVQPVGPHDELAWLVDGPDMVITAHNPTDRELHVTLHCVGDGYVPAMPVVIPARGEWRGMGQVMNRDVHASPCWLEGI